MECESIPRKSLTQNAEDPLGIEGILERLLADSSFVNGSRRM
jgi:hypothetical protein